jgi:hypothetical protein
VEETVPEPRVLEELRKAGIEKLITESRQPIQISNFKSLETVSLAEARSRLVGGDERRDSYIDGLVSWFRASSGGRLYRIYYLGLSLDAPSPARVRRALAAFEGHFILPESSGAPAASWPPFFLVLGVFCGLFLLPSPPSQRALFAGLGLPFVALGLGGRDASLLAIAALALVNALRPSLESLLADLDRSKKLRPSLAAALVLGRPALLVLFSALVAQIHLYRLAPSSLAAAGAGLCFLGGLRSLPALRRGERPVFVPVAILSARKGFLPRARRPALMLASSCLALLLGFPSLLLLDHLGGTEAAVTAGPKDLLLPRALLVGGPNRPGPAAAAELAGTKREADLVDLADWLVHRWHEEAIFYRSFHASPEAAFESIVLPFPDEAKNIVHRFDEAWARAAYRSLPPGGVESLWLSRPGFARGQIGGLEGGAVRPLASIEWLLYIILLTPPLAGVILLYKTAAINRRERSTIR